jgi:hypothetical protein
MAAEVALPEDRIAHAEGFGGCVSVYRTHGPGRSPGLDVSAGKGQSVGLTGPHEGLGRGSASSTTWRVNLLNSRPVRERKPCTGVQPCRESSSQVDPVASGAV